MPKCQSIIKYTYLIFEKLFKYFNNYTAIFFNMKYSLLNPKQPSVTSSPTLPNHPISFLALLTPIASMVVRKR